MSEKKENPWIVIPLIFLAFAVVFGGFAALSGGSFQESFLIGIVHFPAIMISVFGSAGIGSYLARNSADDGPSAVIGGLIGLFVIHPFAALLISKYIL